MEKNKDTKMSLKFVSLALLSMSTVKNKKLTDIFVKEIEERIG